VVRLFLVGQSAGAHLSACALVSQAKKESEGDGTVLPWKASQFKAYMGISGGWATMHSVSTVAFTRQLVLQIHSSRLE
jgi:acetyl esterase/lipase